MEMPAGQLPGLALIGALAALLGVAAAGRARPATDWLRRRRAFLHGRAAAIPPKRFFTDRSEPL